MARETGEESSSSFAPLGLFAVLAAIVGGLVYWQGSLTTSRPSYTASKGPEAPEAQVEARLWQDPLEAVRAHTGDKCIDGGKAPARPGLLLIATIPGGKSFQDHEDRLRSRYAVLAALDRAGYKPLETETISYWCPVLTGEKPTVIPFESFEKFWGGGLRSNAEPKSLDIQLLWLNDDALLEDPWRTLDSLLTDLSQTSASNVRLLGPWWSGTLKEMVERVNECESKTPRHASCDIKIYSPWATADDFLVGFDKGGEAKARLSITRTVATDSELAGALLGELEERGVDVSRQLIAVVSEWDTLYGQVLPLTFAAHIRALKDGSAKAPRVSRADLVPELECLAAEKCAWPGNLHRVIYLRGLDGKVRGETPAAAPDGNPQSAQSGGGRKEDRSAARAALERAEGESQFDYARRLAGKLREMQSDGNTFAAVAVLGSDVYDKLLLLQALRPALPHAIFFTTDLDARLLHPDENRWARNLIVASSYGFDLDIGERSRFTSPPFRDTYQTALYAATLSALGQIEPAVLGRAKAPKLYEIGRTKAHLLPDGLRLPWYLKGFVAALLPMTALVLVLKRFIGRVGKRSDSARAAYALFFLILGGLLTIAAMQGGAHEPIALFEGISIWPSEALRLLAAALAFHFLLRGSVRLRKSAAELETAFHLSPVDRKQADGGGTWLRGLRDCFSSCLNLLKSENRRRFHAQFWRSLMPGWPAHEQNVFVSSLWQSYVDCEAAPFRRRRVALMLAIYFLFGTILSLSFGRPLAPYRGSASHAADVVILSATVIVLMVLIFSVLDATMLCRRFVNGLVRGLGHDHTIKWPRKLEAEWPSANAPFPAVWHTIDLVARRTGAVVPLVYYPFVVLGLVVVSRAELFDRWEWTPALLTVLLVNLSFVFLCSLLLRRSAESARGAAVEWLRRERMKAQARQDGIQAELLKLSLDEVERERRGAFAPLLGQPAILSLLIPSGGIGIVKALEPLANLL